MFSHISYFGLAVVDAQVYSEKQQRKVFVGGGWWCWVV